MVHASIYTGNVNRKIAVQASLGISMRPYPKNNKSKKGWMHGSSTEFKSQ
jgi:hypothetical protein